MIDVRMLGPEDAPVLERVADGVFDGPVDPGRVRPVLADPRHHLAAALDGGRVVGMASGVHYLRPDKPPELWINEVGVAPTYRRRGVARRLVECLLAHARDVGCVGAWVLAEETNTAARALYESLEGAGESASLVMFEFSLGPSYASGSSE